MLMFCREVRPRHHSPGPSRSMTTFFPSWKASPPDLRRRPSSCPRRLPLHFCHWVKGFWFPRTRPPGTVSEPASSSAGRSQGLREEASDTRSAPLCLSNLVQGRIVQYLINRYLNGRCLDTEYLPKCPDDCSQGQRLRWCPTIAPVPRNIISTFLRA